MRATRYCAFIAMFVAICYLAALAGAALLYPTGPEEFLDTAVAHKTIFGTPARYTVYNHAALAQPGPKYLILGASPALLGLRPARMSHLLEGLPVHNLSLASADMSELRQEVLLLSHALPDERFREIVFVVGVDYLQFVDRQRRWPNGVTDLDSETSRYGFYTQSRDGLAHPRFTEPTAHALTFLLRPMMVGSNIYTHTLLSLLEKFRVFARSAIGDPILTFEVINSGGKPMSSRDRKTSFEVWRKYMGAQPVMRTAQFEALLDVARHIHARGGRLLIVDLPLPDWHKQGLPYDGEYQAAKRPYFAAATALSGISSLDLTSLDAPRDFFDSVHPNQHGADKWSKMVAAKLSSLESTAPPGR